MKRDLFCVATIFFCATLMSTMTMEAQEADYNKWSIELKGGAHKPTTSFASGYYTETPDFWQASLGVRYMFNNYFGIRGEFGLANLQGGGAEFESNYYRGSLQGVVNLGNVLNFRDWTNTFGLLAHAGAGYSVNTPDSPISFDSGDQMGHIILGISPQVRLGNRVALTTDLSFLAHAKQGVTWDGTSQLNTRGFSGRMFNVSIGLNIYLGKNDLHADWYADDAYAISELEEMDERISKIENDLIDSDQDGVPDYLDREPNTPSGVAVDSKGRAIDRNNNGIPDELEQALEERYVSKEEFDTKSSSKSNTIKELINEGYVNVYFRFNSTQPEVYSLQSLNYLIVYMKENTSATAELIGYADEIGNPDYNQDLSERRAKAVYDLLIQAGVDENRISYRGNGEDDSVNKDSSNARQLVRRVTFKLN